MPSLPEATTRRYACSIFAQIKSWPCTHTTTSFAASPRSHSQNPDGYSSPATTISTATYGTAYDRREQASWQVTTTVSAALVSLRTAWQCALALGTASWKSGTNSTNPLSKQNCPEKEEKYDENLKQHQNTHTIPPADGKVQIPPKRFALPTSINLQRVKIVPVATLRYLWCIYNGEPILFNRGLHSQIQGKRALFFSKWREKKCPEIRASARTHEHYLSLTYSVIVYYYYPQNNVIKKISKKALCWKNVIQNRSIGTRHQNLVV